MGGEAENFWRKSMDALTYSPLKEGYKAITKTPDMPELPDMTPPPRRKESEAVTRKRRRGEGGLDFTQLGTILTSPQGALVGQTNKKTLLGE